MNTIVKKGEIYFCSFPYTYGHEQAGTRPAIVVQNNVGNRFSPTTIVVPLTTGDKKDIPTHLKLKANSSNLNYKSSEVKDSTVLCEQVTTVDKERLLRKIGEVTPEFLEKVNNCLRISLGLHF